MKNFIFFENKIINADRIDYIEYSKCGNNDFRIIIHYSNINIHSGYEDLRIYFEFETIDELKNAYKDLMNKLGVKEDQ